MSNNIPDDLKKIILRYAGKREILLYQDSYPELLKYIIVNNLEEINKDNYKYVQQINVNNFTDDNLKDLSILTSLDLSYNDEITDERNKTFE